MKLQQDTREREPPEWSFARMCGNREGGEKKSEKTGYWMWVPTWIMSVDVYLGGHTEGDTDLGVRTRGMVTFLIH